MPIYEYTCDECGEKCEIVLFRSTDKATCPSCGSLSLSKMLSPTASISGNPGSALPGLGDTACCGSSPGMSAGCAGPGSCCGKTGR